MSEHAYAYFVKGPRTADDLRRLHPIESERPYEIIKTIILSKIDYENFITDMLADRLFLEDNASICGRTNGIIRCLLVKQRKDAEGILVLPEGAWVDIAAQVMLK